MKGRREDKEKEKAQHKTLSWLGSFTHSVAAALMKPSAVDFPLLEAIKTSK